MKPLTKREVEEEERDKKLNIPKVFAYGSKSYQSLLTKLQRKGDDKPIKY